MHSHDNNSSNRIGWAFFLNLGFTIIEFIGGLLTNSTAIMADAIHDLGDSISIGMSWLLSKLAEKDPDSTFTYGYFRFSLLGALINGLVLILGSAWIMFEAIPRLSEPVMPNVEGMLGLAIFGVVVNGYAAYKLSSGKSLNERILNWHLIEDVLGWVAVLLLSVILMFIDAPILDPILSILFTLFILFNVAKNLTITIKTFLQATPDTHLLQEVKLKLEGLESVQSVHHLHFWSLDGEKHVLTGHVVLVKTVTLDSLLGLKREIKKRLETYQFKHTTIELEFSDEHCRDEDNN
ncbi:cation diffusion facilitator family transporter [Aliikangiella marina]|nr:cation diffusion facilitator family transporter [Aliikangiella marina]